MKIKVSDYIVKFLLQNKLDTVFTITGGFAMHFNDSFAKTPGFEIYYQHHEQACGYSAVGYCKTVSKPSIVCTTAGCAATNTITPCLIAHQDSLPVLFISGQVKSTECIRSLNNDKMKLRHYAGSDSDIISIVTPITKYAHEITNVSEINEVLTKALYTLINGRPGPVWLSIPVDIQGMLMDDLEIPIIQNEVNTAIPDTKILNTISELLKTSKRPIIIAGNGIKLGNCIGKFDTFIHKYNIPVVVSYFGTDLIQNSDSLYCGKIGLIGDRTGNFSMQNSDLIISFGCRMAQGIIGYRADWFAREAKIIYIDNDPNELMKDNINYILKAEMDLNTFFDHFNYDLPDYSNWVNKCNHWKDKWQFETPDCSDDSNGINPYFALKHFFNLAPPNKIILTTSGSIVTNVWHMVNIKKGDKYLMTCQGDMGFELTAAIGASIAAKDKMVIPIMGEGSFQLNIQELQTIVHHKLPIKILLFNNNSHGATKLTQQNFFNILTGVNPETGISFPKTEKIAHAYGIKYISVHSNDDVEKNITEFLEYKDTVILEVFCSIQVRYPRLNAVKNEDGTFTNRPFEDMDPFLSREEFNNEMIVKIV